MTAYFERFTLCMTKDEAKYTAHQGQCETDVKDFLAHSEQFNKQLDAISKDAIRAELKGYGAWSTEDLADDTANRERITWLAGGDIVDNWNTKHSENRI